MLRLAEHALQEAARFVSPCAIVAQRAACDTLPHPLGRIPAAGPVSAAVKTPRALGPVTTVVLALSLVAGPRAAHACSSCGSVGDASPALLVANPSVPAPLLAAWDLRLSTSNAASQHGGRESVTELRESSTVRGWPLRFFGIEASHSAIGRWFSVGNSEATAFVSGDFDLLGRLQARLSNGHHLLGLGLGARFGTAPELRDEYGFARAVQLQVGSGAADFLAHLEYVCAMDKVTIAASLRGRYAAAGRYQWQPGASLSASFSARYRFTDAITAGVSVDTRAALRDTLDRAPVEGTGGLVLAASPAVSFRVIDGLWIGASASFTLGQWWRGVAQDGVAGSLSVQWTPMIPTPSTVVRRRMIRASRDDSQRESTRLAL